MFGRTDQPSAAVVRLARASFRHSCNAEVVRWPWWVTIAAALIAAVVGAGAGASWQQHRRPQSASVAASVTSTTSRPTDVTTIPSTPPVSAEHDPDAHPADGTCGDIGMYRQGTMTQDAPGYRMKVTSYGSKLVEVVGWIVTFSEGGVQTGADSESVEPVYLQPGQSFVWLVTPGHDGWSGAQFSGRITMPGSCTVGTIRAKLVE